MSNYDGRVARFTNLSDEDFTHSYDGQPFFVKAGESMVFPYALAAHLAKHLARKILITKADNTPPDPRFPDKALWTEEQEAELAAKITSEVYETSAPRELTEREKLNKRVEDLNKSEILDAPVGVQPAKTASEFKDKKAVISELEALGMPVDPRMNKAQLEEALRNARANSAPDLVPASAFTAEMQGKAGPGETT